MGIVPNRNPTIRISEFEIVSGFDIRVLDFRSGSKYNPPGRCLNHAGGLKREGRYFFFFFGAAAAAWAAWVLAMRCWNLSTRPAVSTNFCWPV
jgi:hypothetical protein